MKMEIWTATNGEIVTENVQKVIFFLVKTDLKKIAQASKHTIDK